MRTKNNAFDAFHKLAKVIQIEKGHNIVSPFDKLHTIYFSQTWTPQQNHVVERKNRSLEEEAKTLLNETKLPKYF